MKNKKIIGFLAVIVIAVMAAGNLNVNNSRTAKLSDLSLANVEALAGAEGASTGDCYKTITSTPGHQVKYCGVGCSTWTPGESTFASGKCN